MIIKFVAKRLYFFDDLGDLLGFVDDSSYAQLVTFGDKYGGGCMEVADLADFFAVCAAFDDFHQRSGDHGADSEGRLHAHVEYFRSLYAHVYFWAWPLGINVYLRDFTFVASIIERDGEIKVYPSDLSVRIKTFDGYMPAVKFAVELANDAREEAA